VDGTSTDSIFRFFRILKEKEMADFRTKLLTLAGVAMTFSGMAFGQVNCTTGAGASAPQANAVFLRAEGKTEQVADLTFKCDTTASNTQAMTVTVYLSPAVNVTSKVLATATGLTEATADMNAGTSRTLATVSGNQVSFTIPATPAAAAGGSMTIVISNIKVDATAIATGSGVPTAITETVFVGGTGAVPAVLTTTPSVAFVQAGIRAITSSGIAPAAGNPICGAITAAASNFTVNFGEGFGNAFKIQGTVAGNAALNSWFANNTETGLGATSGATTNLATSGTRVKIVFNNVPAGVTIYVPVSITATAAASTTTFALTSSETGAYSAVAASTAAGAPAASAAIAISGGTGTAVYEYRGVAGTPAAVGTSDGTQEAYAVPVSYVAAAGALTAPAGAVTATVSFAPIGAASNVPNFVSGTSTTTVNGNTFIACSTTILFPYVTNQAGFESGIAIANASVDLLGTPTAAGAPTSSLTGQSGTCKFTFFGNATAASNPAAFTTSAAVAPGTTWTGTLTSIVGGTAGNFGGYMIVTCNFQFAHGFTYITYNIGQSSGMAMGYTALVIPGARGAAEALNN